MNVVVMGVTGCGKSTVGSALAQSLGWRFLDADDFHPEANVRKMAAGTPLVDDDRWPWLDRLAQEMRTARENGESVVLACSALKAVYRERLRAAGDVRFVLLDGTPEVIAARIATRQHRYMPPSLLPSQFATLERPADAIVVAVDLPLAEQLARIRQALGFDAAVGRDGDRNAHARPHPHPDTAVTRLGRHPPSHLYTINPPVYRASTVLFPTLADVEGDLRGEYRGLGYGLRGTPTTQALEQAVAELEGGHCAFVVPSGLSAITVPLLALLSRGDHLLVPDSVYGPTRRFCDLDLVRFGIETTYYDPLVGAGIDALLRPSTRVVFVESPGSVTFEVQDVPAIARAAHTHGAYVLMDNTWATPIGFPSFAHGVDVSIHAGTKYLAGHSDVLIGLVVCNEATHRAVHATRRDLGVTAGPDDCFATLRGMRTLAVRLERHAASSLRVAEWLRAQPEVHEVVHPALPGSRGYDLWKRDFTTAGGLFAVVLRPGPREAVAAMLDGMRLFGMGYSWGGYESLVMHYDPRFVARTARPWRPSGPHLRLYVGLENADDLIADLRGGLDRYRAAGGAG